MFLEFCFLVVFSLGFFSGYKAVDETDSGVDKYCEKYDADSIRDYSVLIDKMDNKKDSEVIIKDNTICVI